jgi:sodium/potassium/calcium exchanger 6
MLLFLDIVIQGVTLLAIGNGAPDIFSVMAAFRHSDPKTTSLAFGALFGAGMYVTCFVVGLIALLGSFPLTKRPFLRDNIFYMIATYWALFMLWENRMDIGVAIGKLFHHETCLNY